MHVRTNRRGLAGKLLERGGARRIMGFWKVWGSLQSRASSLLNQMRDSKQNVVRNVENWEYQASGVGRKMAWTQTHGSKESGFRRLLRAILRKSKTKLEIGHEDKNREITMQRLTVGKTRDSPENLLGAPTEVDEKVATREREKVN